MEKRKVQSVLNVGDGGQSTCKECGMAYYPHIVKDAEVHRKYHFLFANGPSWPETHCTKVVDTFTIMVRSTSKRGLKAAVSTSPVSVRVVQIDKGVKRQVARTAELVSMVNRELQASGDSGKWQDQTCEVARAFVLEIDGRAVGVCTTDPIDVEQSRWMVHRTQAIVPNQTNKAARVGISRIWVAAKWRRYGLATALLKTVLDHSIYGIKLGRAQVSFSQPSSSGGTLATSFNGVRHKSGEILIPVYLE